MFKTSRPKENKIKNPPSTQTLSTQYCDESNFLTDKPTIACQSVDFKT
jgi:50S ribosomal protein L4